MGLTFAFAQSPSDKKKSKTEIKVMRIYNPKGDLTTTGVVQRVMDMSRAMAVAGFSMSAPGGSRLGSTMSALYTFPGKTVSRPDSVRLTFKVLGPARYNSATDYTVKADGELVLRGTAEYEREQLTTLNNEKGRDKKFEEALTLVVPLDVYTRLAKAKKVHIKIGSTDFDLNGEQRAHLQALAASIDRCEMPTCSSGTLDLQKPVHSER